MTTSIPSHLISPDTQPSITAKNSIGPYEFYVTVVFTIENGVTRPSKVLVNLSKEGSVLNGLCDCIARMISLGFANNIPWDQISEALQMGSFEPQGTSYRWPELTYRSLPHALCHTIEHLLSQQKDLFP